MTSVLASVRPDSWNLPLFIHVLGAAILVGATLTATSLLAYARGEARFLRLGYWTLLAVGLPSFIVMRIGAQEIYEKEGWDDIDVEPAWLGIGLVVADIGALVFLVTLIVGGIGVRRLRNDKGAGLLKATMILSLVLLVAYVVAVWAMAGKPD